MGPGRDLSGRRDRVGVVPVWQSAHVDDLVGTQAPRRRLASSDEAVVELERAVPDLASHRRPAPQSVDWRLLEGELETALPADYKLLCEHYPSFELSGFMSPSRPVPGNEVAWVHGTHEELETIAEWCEDADLADPMHPYPAPGGLLPWGTSNQGTSSCGPPALPDLRTGPSPSRRAAAAGGTTAVGLFSSSPIWPAAPWNRGHYRGSVRRSPG